MIVTTNDLARFRGAVAMVDGAFDPLHAGHVDYFRAATELGLPVLCNVAPDVYIMAKRHPLLPAEQRVRVLDSIRHLDYVHMATISTADVLSELRPRFYVKGVDWEGQLPDDEVAVCSEHGIAVAYLAAVTQSSTDLLVQYVRHAT